MFFTLLGFLYSSFLSPLAVYASVLSQTKAGGQEYLDKLTFFGDSTTYGFFKYIVNNDGTLGASKYKLKSEQIWVPPDGTFYLKNIGRCQIRYQEKDWNFTELLEKVKPEILIVTVGINGLRTWQEDDFKKYYEKLIETVQEASPKTILQLQSIYPIAQKRDAQIQNFTNEKIDQVNVWIQELAEVWNLDYLDTNASLKGDDGFLPSCYQNGDGMHLSTSGFQAILEYIQNHMTPKLNIQEKDDEIAS